MKNYKSMKEIFLMRSKDRNKKLGKERKEKNWKNKKTVKERNREKRVLL